MGGGICSGLPLGTGLGGGACLSLCQRNLLGKVKNAGKDIF